MRKVQSTMTTDGASLMNKRISVPAETHSGLACSAHPELGSEGAEMHYSGKGPRQNWANRWGVSSAVTRHRQAWEGAWGQPS